jgi:hypothetical protein
MNEDEKGTEESDIPFNEDQQHMFANENRATNAMRPPVGSQVDPILPGVPTSEAEKDENEHTKDKAESSKDDEQSRK